MNNPYIINVLGAETHHDCHIKNTINAPLSLLAAYVKELPKDTELIVYCASYACPLSRKAWQLLTDLGFTNVYAYEGGINEWHQKGYPCEGPCKKEYLEEQHERPLEVEGIIKEISAEELKKKLEL